MAKKSKKVAVIIKAKSKRRKDNEPKSANADFYKMITRPFACSRSSRGAFCGEDTITFSLRQRVDITLTNGGGGIVCQPVWGSSTGGFVNYTSPALMSSTIVTTGWTQVVWSQQSPIAFIVSKARCLGGGMRFINNASWANTQGNVTAGLVGPGSLQGYGGYSWDSLSGSGNLTVMSASEPAEILWAPLSVNGKAAYSINPGDAPSIANILNGASPANQPALLAIARGFVANTVVTVDVVFHYEAVPLANTNGIIEPDMSYLTTTDEEKAYIRAHNNVYNTRIGSSAMADVPAPAAAGAHHVHAANHSNTPLGVANDLVINSAVRLANQAISNFTHMPHEYVNVVTGEHRRS